MFFAMTLIAPATALPALSSCVGSSIADSAAAMANAFVATCPPVAATEDSDAIPAHTLEITLELETVARAADAEAEAEAAPAAPTDALLTLETASVAAPTIAVAVASAEPSEITLELETPTAKAPTAAEAAEAPAAPTDALLTLETASAAAASKTPVLTLEPEPEAAPIPRRIPRALIGYWPSLDLVAMDYLLYRHPTLQHEFVNTVDLIVNKLRVENLRRDFVLGHDGAVVDVVVNALKLYKYDVDKAYEALTRKWFPFYKWYEGQLPSATPSRRRRLLKLVLNMI